MKPVMAFLDRVVSLIARGPWHWDWWPLEEGAWPLQIMEKVMVDSNFGEGHGGLPGKGEGRGGLP